VKRGESTATAVRHRAAASLLFVYKRVLSPLLHALPGFHGACCFQPTCSEYAAIALAEHGVLRGSVLAIWRILRCNPFNRGGFDPVPPKRASSSSGFRARQVL
jgi:putative membrane protein insertion efficiency factor